MVSCEVYLEISNLAMKPNVKSKIGRPFVPFAPSIRPLCEVVFFKDNLEASFCGIVKYIFVQLDPIPF